MFKYYAMLVFYAGLIYSNIFYHIRFDLVQRKVY